jgi:hypothetical protein
MIRLLLLLCLLASCVTSEGTRWEPTVGLGVQTAGSHSEEIWLSGAGAAEASRGSVEREMAELTFGVTHTTTDGEAAQRDWFAGVKLGFGELESSPSLGGGDTNLDELSIGGIWYLTANPSWTPYVSGWAVSSSPASPRLEDQFSLSLGAGVEVAMGPQFALYSELNYLDPLSDSDATGTVGTPPVPATGTRDYRGLALMFGIRARIGLTD